MISVLVIIGLLLLAVVFVVGANVGARSQEKEIECLTIKLRKVTDKYEHEKTILERITKLERIIVMTSQELEAGLNDLTAQQGKIAAEQAARSDALKKTIEDLQAQIAAGGPVSAGVETAFGNLKAAAQALDDAIPDAPPPQ